MTQLSAEQRAFIKSKMFRELYIKNDEWDEIIHTLLLRGECYVPNSIHQEIKDDIQDSEWIQWSGAVNSIECYKYEYMNLMIRGQQFKDIVNNELTTIDCKIKDLQDRRNQLSKLL